MKNLKASEILHFHVSAVKSHLLLVVDSKTGPFIIHISTYSLNWKARNIQRMKGDTFYPSLNLSSKRLKNIISYYMSMMGCHPYQGLFQTVYWEEMDGSLYKEACGEETTNKKVFIKFYLLLLEIFNFKT